MDLSLPLIRHRLTAWRETKVSEDDGAVRGEGPLLWAHFCDDAPAEGTALVLRDLAAERPALTLAISGPAGDNPLSENALSVSCPADTRRSVRAFLDRWHPDVILFCGSEPRPVLWAEALSRRIPLLAVETDPARHPISLVRSLTSFAFVHARAPDPRLAGRIHAMVPLAATPPPPGAHQSDLSELSQVLATRPVWLTAATPTAEIDLVLAAQEHAAKLSHRLLLILELADPAAATPLAARLADAGLNAILRSDGTDIRPDTQILVADDPGELGLWARLASLTYLGGSLTTGALCDPFVPAALGSVVVHGPHPGTWVDALAILDRTNGASAIADADALGPTVEALLAPDRAAEIAHEAWDIATRGAEASNLTLAALKRALDTSAA